MDEEFRKSMQSSTHKEILDSIEDAKKGELSPHWQEHIRRKVQSAKENGYWSDDADELLPTLKSILESVPQISDTELNRRQLAVCNTELIYDYQSDDYGTLVQITYMSDKGKYTASVFLDPDAAQPNPCAYAHNIEQAMWKWVQRKQIVLQKSDIPRNSPQNQTEVSDDLKTALQYIFCSLRHPETLL